jgi:hypothetical protein
MSGEVNLLFPNAGLDLLGSAANGGILFCAVTQDYAVNGRVYKWPPGSLIRWHLAFDRLGQLGDMDLKQVRAANLAEIAAACDLRFEYTSNPKTANFYGTTARMDGGSGILADQQFPPPGADENTQLLGRYDLSEAWGIYEDTPPRGRIDYGRVDLHETLHGCGVGHGQMDRNNPALIEPAYNDRIRHLQPRDVEQLVLRHGRSKKPIEVAPPPTTPKPKTSAPPPNALGKPVFTSTSQEGKEWAGWIERTK